MYIQQYAVHTRTRMCMHTHSTCTTCAYANKGTHTRACTHPSHQTHNNTKHTPYMWASIPHTHTHPFFLGQPGQESFSSESLRALWSSVKPAFAKTTVHGHVTSHRHVISQGHVFLGATRHLPLAFQSNLFMGSLSYQRHA